MTEAKAAKTEPKSDGSESNQPSKVDQAGTIYKTIRRHLHLADKLTRSA